MSIQAGEISSDPERRLTQGGFTLLEMVVVIALISILSCFSLRFFVGASNAYKTVSKENEIYTTGAHALKFMEKEVRSATKILQPPPGTVGSQVLVVEIPLSGASGGIGATRVVAYRFDEETKGIMRELRGEEKIFPLIYGVSSFRVSRSSGPLLTVSDEMPVSDGRETSPRVVRDSTKNQ